ncbi:MAG: hypothetical protein HDR80_00490 [Bacteroides sp.]|nr:hypothetical protein [Bacteroides sp.]
MDGYIDGLSPESARKIVETAYPDAAKLLATVKEIKGNYGLPAFMLASSLASTGFISSNSTAFSVMRDVVVRGVEKVLKEWAHGGDIAGVGVNGRHEGKDFVIEVRFREVSTSDE